MASLIRRRPLKGVLKTLRRRLASAAGALKRSEPTAKRVHKVRRDIKKARAALRLLKASLLPEDSFKRENRLARDAARLLGPARDAAAIQNSWRALKLPPLKADAAEADVSRDSATFKKAADLLLQARKGASKFAAGPAGWGPLGEALKASYRVGLRAWRRVQEEPSDANYHQWRKRVKDLRYQLELLDPDRDPGLASQSKALKQLSDRLGQDHDLSVLRDQLSQEPARFGVGAETALAPITARQRALRFASQKLAGQLYAVKPRTFERRLRRHWKKEFKS
jgi:CHAD domain-containing protein